MGQKKREPIFHRGKYTAEGCATFWKTNRFKKVDKHTVDYDRLTANELRCLPNPQDAEKASVRASKGNIALAVVLEDQQIKASSAHQAAGANGGHLIGVVNTHILADPGFTDVKLWQAHLLMQQVELLAKSQNMPVLLCGDFNSTPDSAVYEYLRHGSLRVDHEELRIDPWGLLKYTQIGHGLRLSTAYETCTGREAEYTNYTEDFKGTLDYIFFSGQTLEVLAISQVDDESQLMQETALPSSTRPSDHVSLVATFMFRQDAPADGTSNGQNPYLAQNPYALGHAGTGMDSGNAEMYAATAHAYAAANGYSMGAWS